ncbi:DUF3068 domain-containing protein [Nocardioides houyundeii]|uniref:DUF3068 domain-containing protein n=1 Tax=Nocardioides houyundeii TaxID=2045452 RepID=UPI000DF3B934|nr:DUF3068 domain-containing protein [Nocardioides houyundeii]
MRKGAAIVLSVLGAFLVLVAVMAQFYAPDRLMKTPLDVKTITRLDGTAELADGEGGTNSFPVRATSITYADSDLSDDKVVSFASSQCLFKDEGEVDQCVSAQDSEDRLISAETDNFATDRKTGESVNDPKYVPPGSVAHSGVVNKWPFEAEQIDYPYWDGMVGDAVTAAFDRTEMVEDMEVNVYKIEVSDVPAEVTTDTPGTYSSSKEVWIEPLTGQIVNQVDHQERYTADGDPFLILDLGFTDEQVQANYEEISDTVASLTLIKDTVPLVGLVVGLPLLLLGLFLGYRNSRAKENA